MITFKSFMTTYEESIIFEAAVAALKLGSRLKPTDHKQVQSSKVCSNL